MYSPKLHRDKLVQYSSISRLLNCQKLRLTTKYSLIQITCNHYCSRESRAEEEFPLRATSSKSRKIGEFGLRVMWIRWLNRITSILNDFLIFGIHWFLFSWWKTSTGSEISEATILWVSSWFDKDSVTLPEITYYQRLRTIIHSRDTYGHIIVNIFVKS